MEFRSRGAGAPPTTSASSAPNNFSQNSNANSSGSPFKNGGTQKWLPLASVVLLACISIILIALSLLAYTGGPNQANAIKKDKYQAVFLNNGQVYFGHVKDLNNKYLNLQNIYYLQTSNSSGSDTSSNPSSVTLVKLGCELHGPYDQMLINDSQVLFWENLQDNSQVVTKIKQLKTCTASSSSSTQQAPSSSAATQSNTTSTQPTTTTKKP